MFPFAVVVFPKLYLFDFGIYVIVLKIFESARIEPFCVSLAAFDCREIAGETEVGEILETSFAAVAAVCRINVEIGISAVLFTFVFIMVAINVK